MSARSSAAPSAVAAALLAAAPDAQAQGHAAVLGLSLVLAGGVGGAIAGVLAAGLGPRPLRFWPSFGIYLGLLSVAASTWAETLEIVPLVLVLGAFAGILPYAAGFHLARQVVTRLRAAIRGR